MTLVVKDANSQPQNLSTQVDAFGNLVPVHTPAALVGTVATPVSATNPMPVINAAGAVAVDGSGQILTGGVAQLLFGGIAPVNGYLVANSSPETLWVCDVGAASPGGASIPITSTAIFQTPDGYRPPGPVSIFGGTLAQPFAARRW